MVSLENCDTIKNFLYHRERALLTWYYSYVQREDCAWLCHLIRYRSHCPSPYNCQWINTTGSANCWAICPLLLWYNLAIFTWCIYGASNLHALLPICTQVPLVSSLLQLLKIASGALYILLKTNGKIKWLYLSLSFKSFIWICMAFAFYVGGWYFRRTESENGKPVHTHQKSPV